MSLPIGATRRTDVLVVKVTLAIAAVLGTGGGETTELTVLVDGVDDPVHTGVLADGLVGRVDKNDLKVLVAGVLGDPVAVENTESTALASNTLLKYI